MPQLDGFALQKDTFVLLLCQFVNLEGFMPLEICQKLMKVITTQLYDKAWNDSIIAALSGLKGMLPKVKNGRKILKKNSNEFSNFHKFRKDFQSSYFTIRKK